MTRPEIFDDILTKDTNFFLKRTKKKTKKSKKSRKMQKMREKKTEEKSRKNDNLPQSSNYIEHIQKVHAFLFKKVDFNLIFYAFLCFVVEKSKNVPKKSLDLLFE